jgi:hypothetical protein
MTNCFLFCYSVSRLHSVRWYGDTWMMNLKWFLRKRLLPNRSTVPVFSWKTEENQENPQHSWWPGWNSGRAPPECKFGKLPQYQAVQCKTGLPRGHLGTTVTDEGTLIYSHDCCLTEYILPLGHVSLLLFFWWIMPTAEHKLALNYVHTQPHLYRWEENFVHSCYVGSTHLKCMSVWLLSRSVVTWLPIFTSSTDSYVLGMTKDYNSD